MLAKVQKLNRKTFETSRLLDFLSRKELIAQTGHQVADWPLVCIKELVDNALDACEEKGIPPAIDIHICGDGIAVSDNGPGMPDCLVEKILKFDIRVSSREAYVSPCRGAQGNALKTLVAMPFVLSGGGRVVIESRNKRHIIQVSADHIHQVPVCNHSRDKCKKTPGTRIAVEWPTTTRPSSESGKPPEEASLILQAAVPRILPFAEDYAWLNPHLQLSVKYGKTLLEFPASAPSWTKWLPSNPTDPHWYAAEDFERLIAAHICHDDPLVREFIAEFRGLSSSAKQKRVLDAVGLSRARLSDLATDRSIDKAIAGKLLAAMQANTKPVKPPALGIIGRDHLAARCESAGGDPKTFKYDKVTGTDDGLPWVIETCFAYCPAEKKPRRLITGVNWSPGIINPFRQLGAQGESLDSILEQQRVGRDEPAIFVLHVTCPKVRYADRGKSSVIVEE